MEKPQDPGVEEQTDTKLSKSAPPEESGDEFAASSSQKSISEEADSEPIEVGLEVLSGTSGGALFSQLVADIDVMYQHARSTGKPLTQELVDEISDLLTRISVAEKSRSKQPEYESS